MFLSISLLLNRESWQKKGGRSKFTSRKKRQKWFYKCDISGSFPFSFGCSSDVNMKNQFIRLFSDNVEIRFSSAIAAIHKLAVKYDCTHYMCSAHAGKKFGLNAAKVKSSLNMRIGVIAAKRPGEKRINNFECNKIDEDRTVCWLDAR